MDVGLFDLTNFIAALQCTWIKRCFHSVNDNWRYRVTLLGNGDPLLFVNDRKTRGACGGVLSNILESYEFFKSKYAQTDNNYMVVPFYCNAAFGYGRGLVHKLDDDFFECVGNTAKRNTVLGITWSDITNNELLYSREQLLIRCNINLSVIKYNLLKSAYSIAVRRYRKIDATKTCIREFMTSLKKGSKYFRVVINGKTSENIVRNGNQVRTFLRCIEQECPTFPRIKSLLSNWNLHYLNSRIKEFCFKFYNNILGINSRVSHFNPDIDAGCTFCSLTNNRPVPKETVQHLFYYCPTTAPLITQFYDKHLCNFLISPSTFFLANVSIIEKENHPLNITFDVFRYVLWQYKLEKKIPNGIIFINDLEYQMGIIMATSECFYTLLDDCKFFQNSGRNRRLPGIADRP